MSKTKAATPVARGRTRSAPEGAAPKSPVTMEMKTLAKTYYLENKAMNAAKNKATKARASLVGKMDDAKVEQFEFKAQDGENTLTLKAEITVGDVTTIDILKLRKLVTEDQFFRIVGATKGAIEEVAGSDIYKQVSTTSVGTGTRNVSVGPLK